ncbi:MAG TPA: YbaK/EbsC family protein [Anaerolineae bacterium]|nr:YbaK/EbsC family protein [Anaerolineae bacterium]
MRLSRLLGRTFRQPPADAHLISHQLLVRGGFVRALEGGSFAWLPLGRRALRQVESLVGRELAPLGAQEVGAPAALCLADAAVAEAVGREVDSYRQLPLLLLRMVSRVQPEPAARAGLFSMPERSMAEVAALGRAPEAGCRAQVEATLRAVFEACDLSPLWAEAGPGSVAAYLPHPAGDSSVARCPSCGRAAERSWAAPAWLPLPGEEELPTEWVATPGCDTIASLAAFLDIPPTRTLKMVFCSVQGRVACVVIRGDRQVDEAKLARLLGTDKYYPSLEEELSAIGAVGGYASPIGLDPGRVRVVADLSVRTGRNYVSGANRAGFHIRNVNVPRDFAPGEWVDLALVEAGDPCPGCGTPFEIEQGFELGRACPAAQAGAEYQDEAGQSQPLWMACGRLDLVRLLAAVVEGHHDEFGIRWPVPCAPYDIHLVALDLREEAVAAQAEALYGRLSAQGLAVLLDDRDASAGVKFNDADLIGLPLRLTLGKRWMADGQIEAKWRAGTERLRLDEAALEAEVARLRRPPCQ